MPGPWLPHLLRELTDACGEDAATAFAKAYGGLRLYVPSQAKAEHRITQVVGWEAMVWLVERYGGTEILVPQGANTVMRLRQDEARRLIADGASIREAAQRTGLHLRTLERMLKRAGKPQPVSDSTAHYRRDSRQEDLFG